MDTPDFQLRKAEIDDIPALEILIPLSVRTLQAADYSGQQIDGALGTVFGVDRQLIEDGTYFVVELENAIVACGGWSYRRTLFGTHLGPVKDDGYLDPHVDPARIRAFFVDPAWARRGIGTRIMRACEIAAAAQGFTRLELAATLTGIPLYRRHGFEPLERVEVPLLNGATIPVIRMAKNLQPA